MCCKVIFFIFPGMGRFREHLTANVFSCIFDWIYLPTGRAFESKNLKMSNPRPMPCPTPTGLTLIQIGASILVQISQTWELSRSVCMGMQIFVEECTNPPCQLPQSRFYKQMHQEWPELLLTGQFQNEIQPCILRP